MSSMSWNFRKLHRTPPFFLPWKDIELRLEWTLQDLWLGVFWQYEWELTSWVPSAGRPAEHVFRAWICFVPCLPIYIRLVTGRRYY